MSLAWLFECDRSSAILVNIRLPSIILRLDLTDDQTVALLQSSDRDHRERPLSTIAAHPQAAGHPGEVRANGTGAATGQTADAGR
jgi:hypothetical protein